MAGRRNFVTNLVMDQVEKERADEILQPVAQWQLYHGVEVKHYATRLGVLLMGDMPFWFP